MNKVIGNMLAGCIALGCIGIATADAAPASPLRAEPIRLQTQAGWLRDEPEDDAEAATAGDVADATDAQPIADRTAIVAAARQALAVHSAEAYAALAGGADGVAVHATRYGPYVVRFTQRIDGVEVYGARVNVLLDRHLQVRAITGGTAAAALQPGADAFKRDAASSLRSAAIAVDGLLGASALRALPGNGSPAAKFRFEPSPTFVPGGAATVRRVWYPAAQGPVAAYQAEIFGRQPGAAVPLARMVMVAADDGRILASLDLVHDLQPFSYRVFAGADGTPYVDPFGYTNPYPTRFPSGYLPDAQAPMNLVTLSHAGLSTGDPWLADDATETSGNNVDAFFNFGALDDDGNCANNSRIEDVVLMPAEGDFRAVSTGTRRFDYAYDAHDTANDYMQCPPDVLSLPPPVPSTRLNAKIVQAFYATNWLHDLFYDLGFDEVAGNMQIDNYGRGGVGADPLHVSAGTSLTFAFASPEDGGIAGLFLGINDRTNPYRDVSALDFSVLGHEWSHTMFGRLTRMNSYFGQQFALNEGIADFVGLMLTVREQDRHAVPGRPPFYGNYAIGAYMNRGYDNPDDPYPPAGSASNPDDTYYHGIRRFPHSADLAINPLTFKHIGMDHPLPASPHAFDWKGRSLTNAEPHTAGEVWTEALWQCSRHLLAASPPNRFEQTRNRFLANLVASLKLVATDADYTDARDALLFTIRADSEADYRRCRAGFAERGFGAGAIAPPRDSINLRGVVESFDDRERALSIVDVALVETSGGDGDGVLDRGEAGQLRITVRNSGFSPLGNVRLRADASAGSYAFPNGRTVDGIALAPGATHTATIDVRVVSRLPAAELPLALDARDLGHPSARAREERAFRVNYDLVRDARIDTLATEQGFAADWTSVLGDRDYPYYCFYSCVTHWQREPHLGAAAYVIGDPQALVDAHLQGQPFLVSADPLRVVVRHDYAFDRLPNDVSPQGSGTLEVSIDGGDWESATPHLAAGSAAFAGASSGWRTDTLDFGTALAGHRVQLRWHATIEGAFFAHASYWAIGRVEVQGAAEPMFSTLHADVN